MFELISFLVATAVVFSILYYKERAMEKDKIPFAIRKNKTK